MPLDGFDGGGEGVGGLVVGPLGDQAVDRIEDDQLGVTGSQGLGPAFLSLIGDRRGVSGGGGVSPPRRRPADAAETGCRPPQDPLVFTKFPPRITGAVVLLPHDHAD